MTGHPLPREHAHRRFVPESRPAADSAAHHGTARMPGAVRSGGAGADRRHPLGEPGPAAPTSPPDGPHSRYPPHPPDTGGTRAPGEDTDRLRHLIRGAGPPAIHRPKPGPASVRGPVPLGSAAQGPALLGSAFRDSDALRAAFPGPDARAAAFAGPNDSGAASPGDDSRGTPVGQPDGPKSESPGSDEQRRTPPGPTFPGSGSRSPTGPAPGARTAGPQSAAEVPAAGRTSRAGAVRSEHRTIGPTGWAAPSVPADPPEPERVARAALTRLIEPGDAAIGRAVQRLGVVQLVQGFYEGAPSSRLGLGADRIAAYQQRLRKFNPAADLERIAKLGGKFIIPGDTEWPSQLDDLGDSRPIGLWVRGLPSARLPSLRLLALRSVAVVGSRACTAYGRHVAGQLGSELAERGWVVVSGAAYGVDTAAHLGALAVNGVTIAVLASGVDICYPRGNEALIERIGRDGLLVSELALGMNPTRFRFVLRNRVIAALTRGTVVIEAAPRSGALSTARRARDLNRHTMGVPGPITSELSAGVHALIRSGAATMVTSGAEVGELIGSIGADLAPERVGPILPRDALEPPVARVLEAVPASAEGAPVQRLAQYAALSESVTVQHLHELSSLGFVERHGAHWRLVRRK